MHDPLGVRRLERLRDPPRDGDALRQRQRPVLQPLGKRRALDQFEDQGLGALHVLDAVDGCDVRMVE